MTQESAKLTWSPPDNDGGCEIKWQSSSDCQDWEGVHRGRSEEG